MKTTLKIILFNLIVCIGHAQSLTFNPYSVETSNHPYIVHSGTEPIVLALASNSSGSEIVFLGMDGVRGEI